MRWSPNDEKLIYNIGTEVYIADTNGFNYKWTPFDRTQLFEADTVRLVSYPEWSPSSNSFFFRGFCTEDISNDSGYIYEVSIETKIITGKLCCSKIPLNRETIYEHYFKYSPNSDKAVYCSLNNSVYNVSIIDLQNGNITILESAYDELLPYWSNTSDVIFFLRDENISPNNKCCFAYISKIGEEPIKISAMRTGYFDVFFF